MSLPRWSLASAAFLAFPAALYFKRGTIFPYQTQQVSVSVFDEPEYTPIYTNASLTQITCTPDDLDIEKGCVYASSTFWHSRGLSIYTSPSVHAHISSLPGFTDPTLHLSPRKPLPSANTPPSSSKYPFYVAPLPGKGMSVLASSVILPGTQILIEHPAVISKIIAEKDYKGETAELWSQLNQTLVKVLPNRTRKEVEELAATVGGPDIPSSVFATNSFQVLIDGVRHAALFPMVSRFNHDCRPNVLYTFSPSTLTMTLRTLRRIEASEELTISYVPSDRLKSTERLDFLKAWGFRCLCHQCTLPDYLADESDHRLDLIGGLRRELEGMWAFVKEKEAEVVKERQGLIGLEVDFEELEKKVDYYLTLLGLERLAHVLPNTYLLAARLLARCRSSSSPSSSGAREESGQPPHHLGLTPPQIHTVLKYVTLAIDSGLNTFGKNWGSSYNELIKLEREMQEMLMAWEQMKG